MTPEEEIEHAKALAHVRENGSLVQKFISQLRNLCTPELGVMKLPVLYVVVVMGDEGFYYTQEPTRSLLKAQQTCADMRARGLLARIALYTADQLLS